MQEMWYLIYLTFILDHGSELTSANPPAAKPPANWQDGGENHKGRSEKNLQFEIKTL